MDEQTYLKERVDNQLDWFERKSSWNQKRHRLLKITVLVTSVTIPFLVGIFDCREGEDLYWKILIGALGLLVAIVEGIISINKYQENWIQYRATAEALKKEKLTFQTSSGIYYENDQAFNQFVNRVETILGQENQEWRKYAKERGN